MEPLESERNFTPTSTELSGPPSATTGTVVLDQRVEVEGTTTALFTVTDTAADCPTLFVRILICSALKYTVHIELDLGYPNVVGGIDSDRCSSANRCVI